MSVAFNFPGKEKDEEVKLLLRRHPFILFKQNFIFLIYFSIPVLIYVAAKFWLTFILNFPIYPIFVLLVSIYYSFFLMFLLIEWIDYYFDVWVVTNKRLIDVDQVGLFKRVVSETRLDKIQDATVEITGMFGTLFHFGNIYIQTAAQKQRFEIKQVSEPAHVRTTILNLYDKYSTNLVRRAYRPPKVGSEAGYNAAVPAAGVMDSSNSSTAGSNGSYDPDTESAGHNNSVNK